MKLEELKRQAALILAIPDTVGEFSNVSFEAYSGGAPSNQVGVKEVSRGETFKYNTTANGEAYSGEVVILCKDTGARDKKNRRIYVTPEDVVFVYNYSSGSPASFDYGVLTSPDV